MPDSTVRLAMATAGTLALSLFGASIADAKPARHNPGRSQPAVCGAPADVRSLVRPSEVRRVPRKVRFRTLVVVHRHIMAKLQRDQLGDAALSRKTYEDFLKRYPRAPRKREAQEALAELALLRNGDAPSATNSVTSNSN